MGKEEYSSNEHIHRLAIWSASRAVQQRVGLKTVNIQTAINQLNLIEFTNGSIGFKDRFEFDTWHKKTTTDFLKLLSLKDNNFGIAAKILNCYLKVSVVVAKNTNSNVKFIHPPIDSILLENFNRNYPGQIDKKIRWKKMSAEQYAKIIDAFYLVLKDEPLWKIEKFWEPTRGK